ncbi:MAG: DUF4340 domain-containing protein [Anaerolineae bacterium]
MNRHQQILLGALVVQVILSMVMLWPRQVTSETGEPVFPDLSAEDIIALTIVDNQGQEIALRKVDDTWVLPEGGDYPAKEESITPVLEKLTALSTSTLVARTDASHIQLQVDSSNFQRRLDFETAGGDTYTIYLGSAPRYTATHFRVAGQSETYLTTELSSWEVTTQPNSWVDTVYTSIDQETLTSVSLENANGTFTFVKDGEDWTLADLEDDETIAAGKINAIVRNASSLSLQAPLGKEEEPGYGMDAPNAVVTLETEDGGTHILKVGALDEENNGYIVKYSDSPYYVRVAQYNVSAMVENSREDFLTVEPTPTPEGAEAPGDTP